MAKRMSGRARGRAVAISAAALVVLAGCSSGSGSKVSGPTTVTAQQHVVKGTLTKGRGVVAWSREAPSRSRSWLAVLAAQLVGTAEAVTTGQPAVGVPVQLQCAGGTTASTTTSSQGGFEFDSVTGTSCTLTATVGGQAVVVASNILLGAQPAEIQGVINLTGTAPGGLQQLEIESEVDDENGAHTESHDGTSSGSPKNGPGGGSSSSSDSQDD